MKTTDSVDGMPMKELSDIEKAAEELREQLSSIEHERWASWQRYVFEKCEEGALGTKVIPSWAVEQWTRQIKTPYSELTEIEKDADRREVDKYLPIIANMLGRLL